jgi:hypothetical protein
MVEGSSRRLSQIFDAALPPGDWMFKKDDLVFGPLPAKQLIDKLLSGEISGATPVREEGGEFRPLREVPHFTVHLAKAEAKLRVQRETDHFVRGERRSNVWRIATVSVLLLGALALAGGGAFFVVMQRQHRLQREIDDIPITGNPPELAGATGTGTTVGEDEVALPALGSVAGPNGAHRPHHPAGHTDTDGLVTAHYETPSLIATEIKQKGALIPCIKQELTRTPGFRGDVRFSVAIGNDGKVAKLWMDDQAFKDSPLQQCFERVTSGWKFASYEGERATISDSFHVGH